MKRPITFIIVIGIIVLLVGSLTTHAPDPAQFSATISGDISRTLSFNMQDDNITLASGTRPSVGEFQLIGLTSQNNHVIVTLGYPGNEMPEPGGYLIRGEPESGNFFGGVLDFSNAGDINSLPDALETGSGTIQYTATSGSIVLEKRNDVYSGHFTFSATSPTSEKPVQVVGNFSNLGKDTTSH
ncbi:MAG: hypothetical protein H0X30_06065 [Anaerolineae bacterium]|nr:hypothetical protein [Anaerolineae bacterium]